MAQGDESDLGRMHRDFTSGCWLNFQFCNFLLVYDDDVPLRRPAPPSIVLAFSTHSGPDFYYGLRLRVRLMRGFNVNVMAGWLCKCKVIKLVRLPACCAPVLLHSFIIIFHRTRN